MVISQIKVTTPGTLVIETEQPHGYEVGQYITIAVAGKDDRWLVTEVPNPNKFCAVLDGRTRNQRRIQKAMEGKAWRK